MTCPAHPSTIIAVHLNYASRAAQRGRTPAAPSYFLKPPSSVHVGDGRAARPDGCELLAFEGEIAVLLGRDVHRVDVATASTCIAGVRAANDLGVYDYRHADRGSNLRSKGMDGFTPLSEDAIDIRDVDEALVTVRTWHNGQLVQDSSDDQRFWSFAELIADLSRFMTLREGDLILTGTPAGSTVAEPGDEVVVAVEVEGRGRADVTTTIVQDEPVSAGVGAQPQIDQALRDAAHGR